MAAGDPAFQLAGKNATHEQIATLRAELGLDKPLVEQYFIFIKQVVTLDWGQSWHTNESINKMILRGISPTLSLTLPPFVVSFFLCLAFAFFSTHFRNTWIDRSLVLFCLAQMSISYLVFILYYQYFFAFQFNLFPINGWDPSYLLRWKYLFLPWLISVSVSLGPNILVYRSALMDEAIQDYVTTAKAKGISHFYLYFRHILRNAMIPISTLLVMQVPYLITGSLLLEAFFGIPGLGGLLIQGIQNADFPVVKAMTIVGSIVYVIFNLFADLCYSFFDPRVEFK